MVVAKRWSERNKELLFNGFVVLLQDEKILWTLSGYGSIKILMYYYYWNVNLTMVKMENFI